MKLCIISDTHNKHKTIRLPDADVLIHCGDFSSMGYEEEVVRFLKWFSKQTKFKYRIFIAGNHDYLFEEYGLLARNFVPDNVIYLEDSGVWLDGYYFYGTPVSITFNDWAFTRPEEKLKQHWDAIPDNTDVLITHSPPMTICDYVPRMYKNIGSPTLYKEVVERIKPKVHCFGHIHSGHGVKKIEDTTFINASILDEHYIKVYEPIVIDI